MDTIKQEQAALEQGYVDNHHHHGMGEEEEEEMSMGDDNDRGSNNNSSSNLLGGGDDKSTQSGTNTSLDGYVGKGRNAKYMKPLPEDFQPSEMDVICGRGKRIWEWKVRRNYSLYNITSLFLFIISVHLLDLLRP